MLNIHLAFYPTLQTQQLHTGASPLTHPSELGHSRCMV